MAATLCCSVLIRLVYGELKFRQCQLSLRCIYLIELLNIYLPGCDDSPDTPRTC